MQTTRVALTRIVGSAGGAMSQQALTSIVGSCGGGMRIRALTPIVGSCAGQMADNVTFPDEFTQELRLVIPGARVQATALRASAPILVRETNPDLRTVANSGSCGTTPCSTGRLELLDGTLLNHRIIRYVPTTGEYVAMVCAPNLSVTTNTVILLRFGNAATAVTEEDVAGVCQERLPAWDTRTGIDLTGQGAT